MNITLKAMMIIGLLMSTLANFPTDRWWETLLKLSVAVALALYFDERPKRNARAT